MRVKIFVAALLSASAAGLGGYLSASSAGQVAQVKEVAGYREWQRINPELQAINAPSEMG